MKRLILLLVALALPVQVIASSPDLDDLVERKFQEVRDREQQCRKQARTQGFENQQDCVASPEDLSWWQAMEPSTQGETVWGTPVSSINKDWVSARLLSDENVPPEADKDYGWQWVIENNGGFQLQEDVDNDGAVEQIGVGAYRAVDGSTGNFLLVLGPDREVEYLKAFPGTPRFMVITTGDYGIQLGHCLECDAVTMIPMNEAQEKAACVVPKKKLASLKQAHLNFSRNPSTETAEHFLASWPGDFCRFNEVYGYSEVWGAGPLYSLEPGLHELLPELPKHLNDDELARRYLLHAVDGRWHADSISFFQESLRSLVKRSPGIVVEELATLDQDDRDSALYFLFDGIHPVNYREFAEAAIADFCEFDGAVCVAAKMQWRKVLAKSGH